MGVYKVDNPKRAKSPWAASHLWVSNGGRKRHLTFHPTKRAAEAKLSEVIGDIDKREYIAPRDGHTIGEVCDFYLRALRVKESTAQSYTNNVELYIRPLLGHRVAKDLTRQDVEAFAVFLRKPLEGDFLKVKAARRAVTNGGEAADWEKRMAGKPTGSRTVSATLTHLTMILNYAVESKWIRSNPAGGVSKKTSGVRRVDKDKVLDKGEARKLIEATCDRWRPYIWFALATGMRKSELAGLQWGDIDFEASLVHVRRQCYKGKFTTPKSENGVRDIPLAPEVVKMMKAWKLACPITDDNLVFPSDNKKPTSGKLIDKYVFHPARAAAGFERPAARAINFHGLRHTFASTLLGDGVAAFIVSRLIGHASVAFTLARYAHWTQDHLDTARAATVAMYGDVRARSDNGTRLEHATVGKIGERRN
jgi:integrase